MVSMTIIFSIIFIILNLYSARNTFTTVVNVFLIALNFPQTLSASGILFLFARLFYQSQAPRGETCSSPLRRSRNCARHSLWRGDHRALPVQGYGFINVPVDGSPGTQDLRLYWNPDQSVYNQDRVCHVYDPGATQTCYLQISRTTPDGIAPLSCMKSEGDVQANTLGNPW